MAGLAFFKVLKQAAKRQPTQANHDYCLFQPFLEWHFDKSTKKSSCKIKKSKMTLHPFRFVVHKKNCKRNWRLMCLLKHSYFHLKFKSLLHFQKAAHLKHLHKVIIEAIDKTYKSKIQKGTFEACFQSNHPFIIFKILHITYCLMLLAPS